MFPDNDEPTHDEDAVPEGVDLLWWHPKTDFDMWEQYMRTFVCDPCGVRWRADPSTKVRCWCCGKFKRRLYR